MKRITLLSLVLVFASCCFAARSPWEKIERIFNKKGTLKGDVYKIAFPRSDLDVSVGEIKLSPNLALTNWLAFKTIPKGVMMMGDLVLLESDIKGVEFILDSAGIDITALHNHIVGESPKLMYMHISGHGDASALAAAMKNVFSAIGVPIEEDAPPPSTTDWAAVDSILGAKGTTKGEVIQYSIPRPDKVLQDGMEIPPYMGTAIAINLQKVDDKAVATGDFVLLSGEIKPVIRTLVKGGILVTAVHNHMLNESPRLFFVHFWGFDDPLRLAETLKAVLKELGNEQRTAKIPYNLKK